jgi:hypothetical protein
VARDHDPVAGQLGRGPLLPADFGRRRAARRERARLRPRRPRRVGDGPRPRGAPGPLPVRVRGDEVSARFVAVPGILLSRLHRDGKLVARDLAIELGLSEDSLRRDLRELAAAGLCQRVYGGALPLSPARGEFASRLAVAAESKRRVAARAAQLITPPEGYLLAARALGVQIARCLVVEDTVPGAAAGQAAGAMVASLRGVAAGLPLRDLFHLAELLPAPV